MNGKDIFVGLKYIGEDLIQEAEYGQFSAGTARKHRPGVRRSLLIAAAVALMLLLVGCAVVYVLSMQEIKLGEQTVTYDVYDYHPQSGEAVAYVGQDTMTQQVLTLAGLSNSPASKAAREWYAFTENYDPDLEIKRSVWGNIPTFGDEYYGYDLYTQEMKDKLDGIVGKYNLKLRGKLIEFKTPKRMLRAMGLESLLNPDSGAKMDIEFPHRYYESGAMYLNAVLTFPGENGEETVRGDLRYLPKDCFIPDTAVLTEGAWEEWNYTTAGGDNVLILRAEESSSAWILCDTGSYTASIRLDILRDVSEEVIDGVPVVQYEMMAKGQLERIADAIDFSIQPKLIEGWETLPDNTVPAGQEINGYTIEPVSAFTDGYGYQVILKLTAPEGVTLTDPANHNAYVTSGAGTYGYCREDEDGKQNTCHIVLDEYADFWDYPENGSPVYPQGYVIPFFWEDIILNSYDPDTMKSHTEVLAEGTWKFDIPLDNADLREMELLTEPVMAKACVGFKLDGTDVFEDLQITSIKLRSLGLQLTHEEDERNPDFLGWTGVQSHIVMKDGSQVDTGWHKFDSPINLDEVAYLQLADNTIIPMPGVDAETVRAISDAMPVAVEDLPIPTFEDGMELLSEPITLKNLAGYATDATGFAEPLYEYFTFTSIVLHPQGLAMVGSHAFDFPDSIATVVMKDGSEITLTGMNGAPYCSERMSQLGAETTIDVTNADRVILPDGTEITID